MIEHWKLEFEKQMLIGKLTDGKDIKNQYFPKKLFKYRVLNDYTLSNVLNSTAWVSSPLSMNDPYECSVYVDHTKFSRHQTDNSFFWDKSDMSGFHQLGYTADDLEDIKSSVNPFDRFIELMRSKSEDMENFDLLLDFLDKKSKERLNEYQENHIKLLQSVVRIYSMSERNDSLLMWSHYADQHQGVCIEYDLSNSRFLMDNTYPTLYRQRVFDVTEYFLDNSKSYLMSLLSSLYKTEDWQYEKEWRLTIPSNIVDIDKNWDFPKPTAIYFGSQIDQISDEKRKGILSQVIKFLEEQNIPRYKMKLERDRFQMTPQQL